MKYISKSVAIQHKTPESERTKFTYDGYFIFMPLSDTTNKFERLRKGILNNSFMTQGQKNYNFSLFRQTQAIYWRLKKAVRLWKWKRAKVSSVDSDLYMNSLKNFPEQQKTRVLHHGTIYEFRLTDIINIMKKSLTQSITFSPQPSIPKNPYLNMEFDKGHIFHFYMCMKDNARFSIPTIITRFIECNMDTEEFRTKAYPDLVDASIKNHIESAPDEILFLDCVNMIMYLKRKLMGRRISLELEDAKKKEVVNKLKPFLKMHLLATLSCNPAIKYINKELVTKKLRDFFVNNPTFGRRIVSVRRNNITYEPSLFSRRAMRNQNNRERNTRTNETNITEQETNVTEDENAMSEVDSEIDDIPDTPSRAFDREGNQYLVDEMASAADFVDSEFSDGEDLF